MPKFQFSKEDEEKIRNLFYKYQNLPNYGMSEFIDDLESLFEGKYLVNEEQLQKFYDDGYFKGVGGYSCQTFKELLAELEKEE